MSDAIEKPSYLTRMDLLTLRILLGKTDWPDVVRMPPADKDRLTELVERMTAVFQAEMDSI